MSSQVSIPFQIQFLSKRSKNSMFKVERGVATVVPSSYQSNGLVRDIALHPPGVNFTNILLAQKLAVDLR
jgi:hypothetical protein